MEASLEAEAATVRELRKAVNSVTALVELWQFGAWRARLGAREGRPVLTPYLWRNRTRLPTCLLACAAAVSLLRSLPPNRCSR